MNNYESANVDEIGTAAKVIRGIKFWAPFWVDSQLLFDYMDWAIEDIDESDE